ncbi:T9SS type A sorting domain-containing protein [Flavobacterium sp. J27]|uniref:T9SS type A sorting domain-containing protein n=1 Tax=Flavobacterium sp. J27 TaxID=2060419 RepID=UPI001030AB8F|nr:T9SS type A sorting domain-containing protein [Flavobacterium sp. J27]
MKQYYLFLIFLLFNYNFYSQNTYIPDNGFEQLLIDLSVDFGPLDNYVPTANIAGLEDLYIVSNYNISDLTGLEDFASIEALYINNNPITTIDLSGNPILYDVSLTNLNLTSINLSNNSILGFLDLTNNSLTNLDLSSLTNLQYLNLEGNSITDLDLSSKTSLTTLNVKNNSLISLNVKSGNNIILTTFDASNNPSLTCIEVDNDSNATAGVGNYASWIKDATASYSVNCNPLSIPNQSLEISYFYPNPIGSNEILNFKNINNDFTFSIYDYAGKLIDKKSISTDSYQLGNLAKGVYIIQIQTDSELFTNKLLVK